MRLVLIPFLLLSLNSISQIDTGKVVLGHWSLQAFKITPSMMGLSPNDPTCIVKGASPLTLEIKEDSIYIVRQHYFANDTFAFTYDFKTDTSQYALHQSKFILYPNKKVLKLYRKRARKRYEKIIFSVTKITETQLVLESFTWDDFLINPFSVFSDKTYSFQKTDPNSESELNFQGNWFFNSITPYPYEDLDTLILQRDSSFLNGEYVLKSNFEIDYFSSNSLDVGIISRPKPKKQFGVLSAVYIPYNNHTEINWQVNSEKNLLTIDLQNTVIQYSYTFKNGLLYLIKSELE